MKAGQSIRLTVFKFIIDDVVLKIKKINKNNNNDVSSCLQMVLRDQRCTTRGPRDTFGSCKGFKLSGDIFRNDVSEIGQRFSNCVPRAYLMCWAKYFYYRKVIRELTQSVSLNYEHDVSRRLTIRPKVKTFFLTSLSVWDKNWVFRETKTKCSAS